MMSALKFDGFHYQTISTQGANINVTIAENGTTQLSHGYPKHICRAIRTA